MEYKTKEEKGGTCLECGQALYGRTDKKFCDSTCKNQYHGRERTKARQAKASILYRLSVNYRILEDLLHLGKNGASLEVLEKMGFDSSLITGKGRSLEGKEELRCFDIAYRQTWTRICNIRRI